MKNKISSTIVMLLIMFGLLATLAMPIYLMVATSCLKQILPQWFIVVNFILSIFMLVLIAALFLIFIFEDDKKKND